MQLYSLMTTALNLFLTDIQLSTNMHPLICPVTSHRCNPVTHIRNNFLLYLSIFIYFFVWDWAIFIILRKSKPKSGLFSWILENRDMYKIMQIFIGLCEAMLNLG